MTRYGLLVGTLGGFVFILGAGLAALVTDRFDPYALIAAAVVTVGFSLAAR